MTRLCVLARMKLKKLQQVCRVICKLKKIDNKNLYFYVFNPQFFVHFPIKSRRSVVENFPKAQDQKKNPLSINLSQLDFKLTVKHFFSTFPLREASSEKKRYSPKQGARDIPWLNCDQVSASQHRFILIFFPKFFPQFTKKNEEKNYWKFLTLLSQRTRALRDFWNFSKTTCKNSSIMGFDNSTVSIGRRDWNWSRDSRSMRVACLDVVNRNRTLQGWRNQRTPRESRMKSLWTRQLL